LISKYRADRVKLSPDDQAMLHGEAGAATAQAMQFIVRCAVALGARQLVDIEHCHLVGSYHSGAADLRLLRQLVDTGARVKVPTTLNASSACLTIDSPSPSDDRDAATTVVQLYQAMGCDAQLTCAPYHLTYRPGVGANIAWAESNAVVFANSVLGARTNKTVQYLDLCAALTGRMPEYGLYLQDQRSPSCVIDCSNLPDLTWTSSIGGELLGLWMGYQCGSDVPLLTGCRREPDEDLLRGVGAAAASSGALSLFHVQGITPEAGMYGESNLPRLYVDSHKLTDIARPYRGEIGQVVHAICLGAPHYSMAQLRRLAAAMMADNIRACIPMYVTTSRHNRSQLDNELLAGELISRGVSLVVDTCSYYGAAIPNPGGPTLTDSAKWAYYGAGNLGIPTLLGDLHDCLATAASGRLTRAASSPWL
jgi:predicted aconitase